MGKFTPRTDLNGNPAIVYDMDGKVIHTGTLDSIDSMFDFTVGGTKYSIGATDMMDVMEDGTVELYNAWTGIHPDDK